MCQMFDKIDAARIKKLDFPYKSSYFTIARVEYEQDGHIITAEGISRRSFLDQPNAEVGMKISEGRAMKALQRKLEGRQIHHAMMR